MKWSIIFIIVAIFVVLIEVNTDNKESNKSLQNDDNIDEQCLSSNENECATQKNNKKEISQSDSKKKKKKKKSKKKKKKSIEKQITLDDKPFPHYIELPEKLARRDGVKIGHVEEVDVGDDKKVKIKTVSMRPLVFEAEDFLSEEECDYIMNKSIGNMKSGTVTENLTIKDQPNYRKLTKKRGKLNDMFDHFMVYDTNQNKKIEISEIVSVIHKKRSFIYNEKEVKEMFKVIGEEEKLKDGILTEKEFATLNTFGMEDYLINQEANNPRFKARDCQTVFNQMGYHVDPVLHDIRERMSTLSGLPRSVIYGAEPLQISYYQQGGHFHAHSDSHTHERTDLQCCHHKSIDDCRMCRYAVFMVYLNDVEEGGETAFPAAGEKSFNTKKMRSSGNVKKDKYNLSYNCKLANLRVKPKKGKLVLWYNHHLNKTDGWMGELDKLAYHGGCEVIKGEKWIANLHVPSSYGYEKHKLSKYFDVQDYLYMQGKEDQTMKKEKSVKMEL